MGVADTGELHAEQQRTEQMVTIAQRLGPPATEREKEDNGFRRKVGQLYRRHVATKIDQLLPGKRPLPNSLIIGAQKAGTSSIFRIMRQHPDIIGAPDKEVHYFDHHFDRGENWYRSQFPRYADMGLTPRDPLTGKAVLEATPYYLVHPAVPDRVHAMAPAMRLIAILRDPVERAMSHYQHEKRKGREPAETLAQAICLEAERLGDSHDRLASGELDRSLPHQHHSYARRGRYAEQLDQWRALFPRDQLHVTTLETFTRDPLGELRRMELFLGLKPFTGYRIIHEHRGSYDRMPAAERDALRGLFAEDVARLRVDYGVGQDWDF